MSNYTKTVDFAAKDTLPSGDSGKIIKGTEFETEFDNISTAIATKADSAAPTFTGTSVFTNLDINGTVQADGAVTVGVDDTGYDVKFFGATAGKSLLWDESADTLIVTGDSTVSGTLGVTGVATLASLVATTADINAGTIDGTVIGGATAAAISGTTGQFATSLNVDGSVTADGLDVSTGVYNINTSGASLISSTGSVKIDIDSDNNANDNRFLITSDGNTKDRLEVKESGDISFYNAAGDSQALFWDSSASRLGLGTTLPASALELSGAATANARLTLSQTTAGLSSQIQQGSTGLAISAVGSQPILFNTNGAERVQIDNLGNLLVGVTSTTLTGGSLTLPNSGIIAFHDAGGAARNTLQFVSGELKHGAAGGGLTSQTFFTSATERMRIDASGNAIFTKSGGAYLQLKDASAVRGAINVGTSDGLVFTTGSSFTEAMRIDASGNVGIGDTNPANGYLTIRGATTTGTKNGHIMLTGDSATVGQGPQIAFSESGITSNWVGATIGFTRTGGSGVGDLLFSTRQSAGDANTTATEAMRLSGGNLLVGGTSVGDSDSCAIESYGAITIARASGVGRIHMTFTNGGATVGTISTTGSATAYNTSSDQRLKENIVDADDAGSKIDSIQVRKFDWKADGSHQKYGMVAQELLEVAPEAVSAPEDPEEMMGVDYSKLVPMMLKEIQSLRARVAQLES